jgi:membrane associated rhomboid family serine protease
MLLPEEIPGAAAAVLAARKRLAADDLMESMDRLRWYGWLSGGLAAYMFYQGWSHSPGIATPAERLGFAMRAAANSMSMGVALLMFLIFAFIPWYQARKRLRELRNWTSGDLAAAVPVLRFETWLNAQKSPVTGFLLGLIGLVGIAQLMPGDSLTAAGLHKPAYLHGEWWRLLTAPLLHGSLIHFLMNAAALLYLGKRLEVFARWPHVPLVFLFAACVGGEASARFIAAPSVGASGGLMGWLGFLLVFESLHGRLVPRRARRRLLAGVLLTGLVGLAGYRFIDNAAHAGGLLAGMLYAVIVFPKSASPNRPNATLTDRIAGVAALAVMIFSALFALMKILAA